MPRQVVILGAGISGLTCAWYLKKHYGSEVDITILEKGERAGGWIHTLSKEGFLFELGPHSFRGNAEHVFQLIEELGLQDQVIRSHPSASQRYLYTKQKLQPLPNGFLSLLTSPFLKPLLGACVRDLWAPKGVQEEETIDAFFTRRFGKRIASQFADPLVSGIFAGDSHRLSLKACFPKLYQYEQDHRSIIKGMSKSKSKKGIYSFKHGMETLTKELVRQLDVKILYQCAPATLVYHSDHINVNKSIEADQVISAIPAYALSDVVGPFPPLSYATVAVVNVGYAKQVLKQEGFGYLIPSQEQEKILGCIWDSSVFPQQNQQPQETRLTVMLGGIHHPHIENYSEEECRQVALHAIKKHMKIDASPLVVHVSMARLAIPQFEVGYSSWLEEIRQSIKQFSPRLHLCGNAFNGISVNDCISGAKLIVANKNNQE